MKNKILITILIFFLLTTSSTSIILKAQLTKLEDDTGNKTEYYAVIATCSEYKNPNATILFLDPLYLLCSSFKNEIPTMPDYMLKAPYNSLKKSENWKEENIILLLNKNATKENITNALLEMSERVDENDIFLFLWGGHGSYINDTDGDEKKYDPNDVIDEVICPYDTLYANDTISDDELNYYFSKIHCKGMLLIFESCLSGGLVSKKPSLVKRFKNSFKNDIEENKSDVGGQNRIVIMSTLPDMTGHSLFRFSTGFNMLFWLSNSLKYARDKNKDGYISAEEAFKQARKYCRITETMFLLNYPPIFDISFLKREPRPLFRLSLSIILQYFIWKEQGFLMINWPNMQDDYPGDLPIIKK